MWIYSTIMGNRIVHSEIKIIPKNTEKYLSFSVGFVHFKDSYQFLSESLAILVQSLMDKGPDP